MFPPPDERDRMKAEPEVVLYNMPQSFYSQVARLALAEKGVSWRTRIVLAGPPTCESYQPWFMRLNPEGTVPTMVHNGDVLPDSMLIAEYAERTFEGPPLIPQDKQERAETRRWVDGFRSFPFAVLLYGNEKMRGASAIIYKLRIRRLRALGLKHPELAEIYRAKERKVEDDARNTADGGHITELRRKLVDMLGELDGLLAERTWIAGESYSLADVAWTVAVAQLIQENKLEVFVGRPSLARWFEAIRQRPSYDEADIWDHVKPGKAFAIAVTKLGHYLLGFLLVLAALAAGIWWLIGLAF